MPYKLTDAYQNRRTKDELNHKGGQIDGNTSIVNGDLYVNGGLLLPVGSVIPFISETPPAGWLLCDGSNVSISKYRRLYNVIKNRFGTASEEGYFVLPDMRGRVPIGAGSGDGLTTRTLADIGGSETHTLTIDEMPSHTHNVSNTVQKTGDNTMGSSDQTANEIDNIHTITTTSTATGGGEPHNNMQPFIVLNYIIRA